MKDKLVSKINEKDVGNYAEIQRADQYGEYSLFYSAPYDFSIKGQFQLLKVIEIYYNMILNALRELEFSQDLNLQDNFELLFNFLIKIYKREKD